MITIKEKRECCGCGACVQVCPKQCICISADNEGFLYPQVDSTICTNCRLCEKVCPSLNVNGPIPPLIVYAAKCRNENIRMKSSSGGIFTLLAERIISEGGVVFGAKFDESWNVVHDYTETIAGLEAFRGSKYVQSVIGNNYRKAKQFLGEGRKVLFSGTPCQIAGLKKILKKEYTNLLTVDVVCHGTPSPLIWQDYLTYRRTRAILKNKVELPQIADISFRDKTSGWKNFGFKICFSDSCQITPFNKDLFMRGFLKNLYIRPSCYYCVARQGGSGSDISIADYWGAQSIHPELDDDKGVGLVLIYSKQGLTIFDQIKNNITYIVSNYDKAVKYNPCIVSSVEVPAYRNEFWKEYEKYGIDAIKRICGRMEPSIVEKCKNWLRRKLWH